CNLRIVRIRAGEDSEHHCLSARQDIRPSMIRFSLFQLSERLWRPSRRRYLPQIGRIGRGYDDDHVVAAPAGSDTICDGHGCSSADGYFLQFSAIAESEPLSVGREEGTASAFSAGERSSLQAVDSSKIDELVSSARRFIRQEGAVRRKSKDGIRTGYQPVLR